MSGQPLQLRMAHGTDLAAINQAVEAAIMTWRLPERVKRLALPSYRYTESDLAHQHIMVAELNKRIVGVAAWEEADPADVPYAQHALLLHGIYVVPEQQHKGVGRTLYAAALKAACAEGLAGLLVKAQTDAVAFFTALGMQRLEVTDASRDYTNRFWQSCSGFTQEQMQ